MKSLFFSLTALGVGSVLLAEEKEQPNILWLTYEDTSPQFIGCYGNEKARTPNIDNLAKDGVRFTNVYAGGAVSSASRFGLITGLRTSPMGTGNHRSANKIPDNIKGFPYYLRQAGYYTSNNSKTDYNIHGAGKLTQEAWNESSKNAGWWNRKPGQPFFAVYNSVASHQSRTMTNTWAKYEDQVLRELDAHEIIEPGNLPIPEFYRDSPEMQKNMSRVYNSISLMDKEFGQWLNRLEQDGLKDSTIVFCFSDHGMGISRGKGSAVALGYKVAFIIWVPPMYQHLSPWGAGIVTDKLISFEDLPPTILNLAGVEIPDYMQGKVFMGDAPDENRKYVFSAVDRTDESSELSRSVSDGKYMYTRVFMPFQPFLRWNMYYDMSDLQKHIRSEYQAGLLNETQRRILEPRESEYLFDMESDTWEVNNLVNAPEMKDKLNELRQVLLNQIIVDRDAHFIPEYTIRKEGRAPYLLTSDSATYPIKDILETALLNGQGKSVKKKQLELIAADNQYVRYWASLGLISQDGSRRFEKKIVKQLAQENYPPNQINLKFLLFKTSKKQIYKEWINELILKEQDPELLRSLFHLLVTLDEFKQTSIIESIEKRLHMNAESNQNSMFQADEYMRLLLHKLKGLEIKSDDSF